MEQSAPSVPMAHPLGAADIPAEGWEQYIPGFMRDLPEFEIDVQPDRNSDHEEVGDTNSLLFHDGTLHFWSFCWSEICGALRITCLRSVWIRPNLMGTCHPLRYIQAMATQMMNMRKRIDRIFQWGDVQPLSEEHRLTRAATQVVPRKRQRPDV